jgi:hypothetical protein
MFDTVTFRTERRKPPAYELRRLGFTKPFDGSGKIWKWKPPAGSRLPRINWISSQSGDYLTVFEVSLPKLLYGNNVETIKTDAEAMRAVDALSVFASDVTYTECDLRRWDVVRLDACHSWNVTETEVAARVRALGSAHVRRMKPEPFPHGMYWKTKSETLFAYSKHSDLCEAIREGEAIPDEVLQMSIGNFRLERRFLNRGAIKRRILKQFGLEGLHSETVLRASIAEAIINEDVMALNLDRPLVSGDARKARLLARYGFTNTYFRLRSFLEDYADPYLRERMRSEMNDQTFRNYRKELEAVGVLLDNPQPENYAALPLVGYGEASGAKAVSITIQPTQKFLESEWVN